MNEEVRAGKYSFLRGTHKYKKRVKADSYFCFISKTCIALMGII